MNLKDIKLVISDMDGTLLNSKHEVSQEFFNLFKQLKHHNILFVAASGRPHYSIESKLKRIKDDIIVAGENGGVVTYKNEELLISSLCKSNIALIDDYTKTIKNCHPIFCTRHKAYLKKTSNNITSSIKEYYHNYELIDTVEEIPEKVIKTAIYHESDAEKFIYPILKQLNSKFKIKLSGKNWVDICDLKTNKGIALKVISERFNISLNEVLAFGDFKNDTDMLMMTKYSVAMENAHDSIKAICNFETLSNDNNGVEYILKKLISQKEQIL